MNRKEIEDYIEKLKEFENDLTSDNDIDDNFINQLNGVLNKIGNDIKKETSEIPTINNTLVVKVKKIHSNAIIPSYSKVGDAGMDLTITSIIENTSFSVSYGFGLSMEIPKGFVGLVFPRSSVRNYELSLTNCVGVIDSGYRGEIQATFRKHSGLDSISYKVGDRGAQIIILPYPQVTMVETNELSDTERGVGGFGSTGS
jgi:dUTP pyrophosphatase